MTLLLKQYHVILCLMPKLWRCSFQVCAAPQHWHKQKTIGLLSSISENLDLKKAKKCVKGRAGWGLIVTKSCWPQLPGQSCLRDLLKRWRLVDPWNTPWTKWAFRKVLALLNTGSDPSWNVWKNPHYWSQTGCKDPEKFIYCCCPCLWAFFMYLSPKYLESSRISWLIPVCHGGSCWVQWKHHCPLETIRFGQTGIN